MKTDKRDNDNPKPSTGALIDVRPDEFVLAIPPEFGLNHLPPQITFKRKGDEGEKGTAVSYSASLDLRYRSNGHQNGHLNGHLQDTNGVPVTDNREGGNDDDSVE